MPLAKILLTLASLAYPLLWYYGRGNGAFFWLAALMCALWLIRAAMPQTAGQRAVALLLSPACNTPTCRPKACATHGG